MIGNYLSTFGVCVFAYLYPLFLCFKVNDDDDRKAALSFFAFATRVRDLSSSATPIPLLRF